MSIKQIADRLKNARTWYEVRWIEADLRALDGKTVLPEATSSDTPTPRTVEQIGKLIGSCGCGVKTQDVLYHDPYCQYRLLSEQMDAQSELAALKAENARLTNAILYALRDDSEIIGATRDVLNKALASRGRENEARKEQGE